MDEIGIFPMVHQTISHGTLVCLDTVVEKCCPRPQTTTLREGVQPAGVEGEGSEGLKGARDQ